MPTVTGVTEVIELTQNNASINRTREVSCSTEVINITVNTASAVMSGYLVENMSMEGDFNTVEENTNLDSSFSIEDTYFAGISISLVDNSFTIDDGISVVWTPAPFSDSINISSEVDFSITSYLTSIATVVDTFGQVIQTTNLRSTVAISDEQKVSFVALLTDTFNIQDTREIATIANLVSSFTAEGSFTNSLVGHDYLESSFTIEDSQALGFAESLVSTGLFSTPLEYLVTQIELLTDSMTLTDVQVLSASVIESLDGTMQFSDGTSFEGSVYNVVVLSTLEMGDVLWSPDFGAVAWVMNTEGLSIAPYKNYGFRSIAEHAGKIFAVSPEGIFELTGETDEGRKIEAHVKGGFSDFGSPQRKRASDLYMSYTGGMLECAIETYDGPKTVYNYPIEEREANAPRNNRMKVGRGLVSRYWRTEVRNLEGAAFKVYEIGLNIAQSKRRL